MRVISFACYITACRRQQKLQRCIIKFGRNQKSTVESTKPQNMHTKIQKILASLPRLPVTVNNFPSTMNISHKFHLGHWLFTLEPHVRWRDVTFLSLLSLAAVESACTRQPKVISSKYSPRCIFADCSAPGLFAQSTTVRTRPEWILMHFCGRIFTFVRSSRG